MYARTNRCYNERGSRTNYFCSSIPHCIPTIVCEVLFINCRYGSGVKLWSFHIRQIWCISVIEYVVTPSASRDGLWRSSCKSAFILHLNTNWGMGSASRPGRFSPGESCRCYPLNSSLGRARRPVCNILIRILITASETFLQMKGITKRYDYILWPPKHAGPDLSPRVLTFNKPLPLY